MRGFRKVLALFMCIILLVPSISASAYWWETIDSSGSYAWPTVNGQVSPQGDYILFTSDIHRYAYLSDDLIKSANDYIGKTNSGESVGLVAFGGDYGNETTMYSDIMTTLNTAVKNNNAAPVYIKGNHEGSVSDEDFRALTGMPRIGETAVNNDYYFYSFGAYNGTQQFLGDDITALDTYLSTHTDKPAFVISHFPIHYYNARRSSKNADKLIEVLNKYPNVVFLWGHNHTEQDPDYATIRTAGDVIRYGATADKSAEINFTYANLGALRDGINGANGLLAKVSGNTVTFSYISLELETLDATTTDKNSNKNSVKISNGYSITSVTDVNTAPDIKSIAIANLYIDVPLVDKSPSETAACYSSRFTAGKISWSSGGTALNGKSDFDTAYCATVTLTPVSGYSFDKNSKVNVNKEYIGPMTSADTYGAGVTFNSDGTVTAAYTFGATVKKNTKSYGSTSSLEEGASYILASDNLAAEYIYDQNMNASTEAMPNYAPAASDIVVRDGKLISVFNTYSTWTAEYDKSGYILYSTANQGSNVMNYLQFQPRDSSLEAAEKLSPSIYSDWNIDSSGCLYVDFDGIKYYMTYSDGFTFTLDPLEANIKIFKVSDSACKTIDIAAVGIAAPEPGSALPDVASAEASSISVSDLKWNTEDKTADFNTSYTVSFNLSAKSGYSFSAYTTARVSGVSATSKFNNDGTLSVTYTFPATISNSAKVKGAEYELADSIKPGCTYVIVDKDNYTIANNIVDAYYIDAEPVTISSGTSVDVTDNMLWTASSGNGGYYLSNFGQYLSAAGGKDAFGFAASMTAQDSATVFSVTSGKISFSQGPDGKASYIYRNGEHFNYSANTTGTSFSLYQVVYDMPYTDVSVNDYYYSSVGYVYSNGIMGGASDTSFGAGSALDEAEFISSLAAVSGISESDTAAWAKSNGIIGSDFNPTAILSRQKLVLYLFNYARFSGLSISASASALNSFSDVKNVSSSYSQALEWAVENGIIAGRLSGSNRLLSSDKSASRGEAAVILSRFATHICNK